MADDVTVDNGGLTDYVVATDDIGSGRQAQFVKLLLSADGSATAATLDANGLLITTAAEVTEDVAHSGGEVLIGNAAKRTTAPANSAGTDGDWSTLNNDDDGLLWTRPIERPRSTQYSLTTQTSPAFSVNDQLADKFEMTSMSLINNGGGKILNLVLCSNNTTQVAAELWIYCVNPPSVAGTNAAHDQSDANHKTSRLIAIIDFSTWITETSNISSPGVYRGQPLASAPLYYQCNDGSNQKSLWGVLVTRTAVTPGATTDYYIEVTHCPLV